MKPRSKYNKFKETLPSNLRNTPEFEYPTYRYWLLNGEPENFGQAIARGMYTKEDDGYWHAKSIAYNENTGNYEFMKPNWHPTKVYEDVEYMFNPDFRKNFRRLKGVVYDKYVPVNKGLRRIELGLPSYGDGLVPDYTQLAEQERARQWNIAKAYMQNPSLPNIFNAIGAAWNALPFNTTAATVNPYMLYGEAPNAGGTVKPLSTFEKLSKAAKVQNAKSQIVRKAKAAERMAAERQVAQELWERYGNNAAVVVKPNENYVYNEAERAAAIDFLKENPSMKGSIDTDVIYKYSDDSYMYPWNPRIAKLLPTRKSLKEIRFDLDRTLRGIK